MSALREVQVVNKIVSTLRVHIIADVTEDTSYTATKDLVQIATNVHYL